VSLLSLSAVTRRYEGPPPVAALQGVDLTVERGDLVAIEGPSGSGKSTLLNILGLLDRPTSGRYEIDGVPVETLPSRAVNRLRGSVFGFVFQQSHLLPDRTVAANVALGLQTKGVRRNRREALVVEALEAVGLGHRALARARDLSGGERQRAAIARALAGRPEAVLADEPTGNLDSHNATAVIDLLRAVNGQGLTVVVITHDERVAAAARRRFTMTDGTLSATAGQPA
jgi:ABC-type lipoprotein export system ATPase subunit